MVYLQKGSFCRELTLPGAFYFNDTSGRRVTVHYLKDEEDRGVRAGPIRGRLARKSHAGSDTNCHRAAILSRGEKEPPGFNHRAEPKLMKYKQGMLLHPETTRK